MKSPTDRITVARSGVLQRCGLLFVIGVLSTAEAASQLNFSVTIGGPSAVTFDAEIVEVHVAPNYEPETDLVGDINVSDPKKMAKGQLGSARRFIFLSINQKKFWPGWESAVADALDARKLFRESSAKKVVVRVALRELDYGAAKHMLMRINYSVASLEDGEVLFSFVDEYTERMTISGGANRSYPRAASRCVVQSIEDFLARLEADGLHEQPVGTGHASNE